MADEYVIGMDLGGTKLLAGLIDREGVVVERKVRGTDTSNEEAVVAQIEAAVEELVNDNVVGICLGVPSLIDQRTGRAASSVNIPFEGVDLRDRIAERFDLPVALENDANAAAVAEHALGAGRGSDHMVMLTLGTGVGGGLILNGKLYRGFTGGAGELGHMTINFEGPPCQGTCPGIGHLEAYASGTAAELLAREMVSERPDGDLGRAAAEGTEVDAKLAVELAAVSEGDAREVLDRVGSRLGVAIASYVNIFNPEVVVVGGGFARAGRFLLEPARKVVAESALAPARDQVRIELAVLGVEAGLIGAGLVGFEAADAVSSA
ncbi:MAG TPA: ROK family protein [Gaiellaceae bacterium]|nr:ROK family protein [Gaiellaceae bacterium]